MVNPDFAEHWSQMCAIPITFITDMVKRAQREGHCPDDDPNLLAQAIVSMLNQFCYLQLSGGARTVDDEACVTTCLLYTSDAADDLLCVDLGGRRIIKKKKTHHQTL